MSLLLDCKKINLKVLNSNLDCQAFTIQKKSQFLRWSKRHLSHIRNRAKSLKARWVRCHGYRKHLTKPLSERVLPACPWQSSSMTAWPFLRNQGNWKLSSPTSKIKLRSKKTQIKSKAQWSRGTIRMKSKTWARNISRWDCWVSNGNLRAFSAKMASGTLSS
jgi:hypothetical protein